MVKKGIIISDLHCGANSGLTPPDYQYTQVKRAKDPSIIKKNKLASLQKEVWEWYIAKTKALGKIDFIFLNGDAIDGSGKIIAGAEQIDTDVNIQSAMAVQCMEALDLKKDGKIVMTYGSPYHTGKESDHEDNIAKALNAKIGSHVWVDVNGCIFDLKHNIGRSTLPHAKGTSLAKEQLTSMMWALKGLTPNTDVFIRSHIHYPFYVGDPSIPYLSMSTPAMQWGTRYGSRQCTGTVDMGFLYFEVNDKGEYKWHYEIAKLTSQKTNALKI